MESIRYDLPCTGTFVSKRSEDEDKELEASAGLSRT